MMNKRADLTIMVLVIGIVGIFILTILSFVKVDQDIDEDFLGIGLIETINSISEESNFEEKYPEFEFDYGKSFVSDDEKTKIILDGNKIISGSYAEDGKILVSIKYEK